MAGAVTPFTELSPQNLAAELWNSLASEYAADGTMGSKLNAAGSAGDPWTGNIEGVLTAKDAMRILLSVAAGNTVITDNGNGTALVEFKSRDGATSRVSATMDGSERVNVIINTV
jgi:hypothetical protein